MMRINLLPENERASLHVVQLSTMLVIAGIVLVASLSFATVYLRWQVVSERERQASYQSTMTTMVRYRTETNKLQQETKRLKELLGPLEAQLRSISLLWTWRCYSIALSQVCKQAMSGYESYLCKKMAARRYPGMLLSSTRCQGS
jgi:hypothetical protein